MNAFLENINRIIKVIIRDHFSEIVVFIIIVLSILSATVISPITIPIEDNENNTTLSNSLDHLVWSVHVGNTHISDTNSANSNNFETFLLDKVKHIDPHWVFHSGGIVEGRGLKGKSYGNEQVQSQWTNYETILSSVDLYDKEKFFDVRGDSDSAGVEDIESDNNYYYDWSAQKIDPLEVNDTTRSPVVLRTVKICGEGCEEDQKDEDKYNFLLVDFNQYPSPGRGISLFGSDSEKILTLLEFRLKNLTNEDDPFIILSHYPLSMVDRTSKANNTDHSLSEILDKYPPLVMLAGHGRSKKGAHSQLLGWTDGVLELQVGNFDDDQAFRILAIDNGLVSFIDLDKDDDWPYILITNPKDAKYLTSTEPLELITNSEYIRVLVFNHNYSSSSFSSSSSKFKKNPNVKSSWEDLDIDQVSVWIDDELIDASMDRTGSSPLFTTKWDPSKYKSENLHKIKVKVTLFDGVEKEIEQYFSVTGKRKYGGITIAEILQRMTLMYFVISMFIIFFLIILALLIIPKIYRRTLILSGKWQRFESWIKAKYQNKKLTLIETIVLHFKLMVYKYSLIPPPYWYIFIISLTALLTLPIFIAPMLSDDWGTAFIWSTYIVDKSFYSSTPLLYCLVFVCFVIWPVLQIITSRIIDPPIPEISSRLKYFTKIDNFIYTLIFLIFFFYFLIQFGIIYGAAAVFFSFGIIWNLCLIMGLFIWIAMKDWNSLGATSLTAFKNDPQGTFDQNQKFNIRDSSEDSDDNKPKKKKRKKKNNYSSSEDDELLNGNNLDIELEDNNQQSGNEKNFQLDSSSD
ncbi:helicase related [Anaeramoeba flamelloides]|uniref:Helicase related n=1 Tax=Anaeramoeba flamelloides TaxID=1746091 RepID=A0ABQ8XP29_9EUKA|nr:helicase related [Anaeramoeba flamelloides]